MARSSLSCRYCDAPLREIDIDRGRGARLLGHVYCRDCLEAVTLFCQTCGRTLKDRDFESGRAVTLMGKRYCEGCLARAVEESRKTAAVGGGTTRRRKARQTTTRKRKTQRRTARREKPPAPLPAAVDESTCRRKKDRFVPPRRCRLVLKRPGLLGLLGGNAIQLWLDVSEGGCRAIVAGKCAPGDKVDLVILNTHPAARFDVTAVARHVKPSKKYTGSSLVGFKFRNPPPVLLSFIRGLLEETPALAGLQSRRSRRLARGRSLG